MLELTLLSLLLSDLTASSLIAMQIRWFYDYRSCMVTIRMASIDHDASESIAERSQQIHDLFMMMNLRFE